MVDFNIPSSHQSTRSTTTQPDPSSEDDTRAVNSNLTAATNEMHLSSTYSAEPVIPVSPLASSSNEGMELVTNHVYLAPSKEPPKEVCPVLPLQTSVELPVYSSLQAIARSTYSEHIDAYEMCVMTGYLSEPRSPDLRRWVFFPSNYTLS